MVATVTDVDVVSRRAGGATVGFRADSRAASSSGAGGPRRSAVDRPMTGRQVVRGRAPPRTRGALAARAP
eukprot:15013153-Alexandrium_andersonii.AAC.1